MPDSLGFYNGEWITAEQEGGLAARLAAKLAAGLTDGSNGILQGFLSFAAFGEANRTTQVIM